MARDSSSDITRFLTAWESGDEGALERLIPLIYEELRCLARGRMRRERAEHTLQTTALVHEAFLRLVDQERARWESRGQFFAVAARMMRRVLVDYARRHRGRKRGGGCVRLSLDAAPDVANRPAHDVLAVHDALTALAAFDARKARVVELRFFGGLSIAETARALSVSAGTVMRDWTLAKAWLQREIRRTSTPALAET